jgi:hypothetical protein
VGATGPFRPPPGDTPGTGSPRSVPFFNRNSTRSSRFHVLKIRPRCDRVRTLPILSKAVGTTVPCHGYRTVTSVLQFGKISGEGASACSRSAGGGQQRSLHSRIPCFSSQTRNAAVNSLRVRARVPALGWDWLFDENGRPVFDCWRAGFCDASCAAARFRVARFPGTLTCVLVRPIAARQLAACKPWFARTPYQAPVRTASADQMLGNQQLKPGKSRKFLGFQNAIG